MTQVTEKARVTWRSRVILRVEMRHASRHRSILAAPQVAEHPENAWSDRRNIDYLTADRRENKDMMTDSGDFDVATELMTRNELSD